MDIIDFITQINPFLFLFGTLYWFKQARNVENEIVKIRYAHTMHLADLYHLANEQHINLAEQINSKLREAMLNDK